MLPFDAVMKASYLCCLRRMFGLPELVDLRLPLLVNRRPRTKPDSPTVTQLPHSGSSEPHISFLGGLLEHK